MLFRHKFKLVRVQFCANAALMSVIPTTDRELYPVSSHTPHSISQHTTPYHTIPYHTTPQDNHNYNHVYVYTTLHTPLHSLTHSLTPLLHGYLGAAWSGPPSAPCRGSPPPVASQILPLPCVCVYRVRVSE